MNLITEIEYVFGAEIAAGVLPDAETFIRVMELETGKQAADLSPTAVVFDKGTGRMIAAGLFSFAPSGLAGTSYKVEDIPKLSIREQLLLRKQLWLKNPGIGSGIKANTFVTLALANFAPAALVRVVKSGFDPSTVIYGPGYQPQYVKANRAIDVDGDGTISYGDYLLYHAGRDERCITKTDVPNGWVWDTIDELLNLIAKAKVVTTIATDLLSVVVLFRVVPWAPAGLAAISTAELILNKTARMLRYIKYSRPVLNL